MNELRIDTAEWAVFIREERVKRNLTLETAAHPLGPFPAGVATLRRWENNTGQVASIEKVFEVAEALHYPIARLLVRLGLLGLDDVGIGGLAPPQPPIAHHPITQRIDAILDNEHVPGWARDWLVDLLEAIVNTWGKNLRTAAQQQPHRTPRKAR